MYIPRPILSLLLVIYLLSLLGGDWLSAGAEAWYRPFLAALLVIGAACWAYSGQDSDEL